jgi:hypothetical protein
MTQYKGLLYTKFKMKVQLKYSNVYPSEEIIQNLKSTLQKSQSLIITLHGPLSNTRQRFPFYTETVIEGTSPSVHFTSPLLQNQAPLEMCVRQYEKLRITPQNHSYSYILDGLLHNDVTITGKINHIVTSRCSNLTLRLLEGTISGIDILYGDNINIELPSHTYTNLEYVECSSISGQIVDTSKIKLDSSWNVRLNNEVTRASPFVRLTLENNVWSVQSSNLSMPKISALTSDS